MKTGLIYTFLIFGSGYIFGLGGHEAFLKDAVRTAYQYGRQSVIVEVLDNGDIVEVASR